VPRLSVDVVFKSIPIGAAVALPACAAVADEDDTWRYRVAPYLWIATLTGDFGAEGVDGSTDSDYSFWALENLERYWSVHFEARAAKWGWFADALAIEYRDAFDNAIVDTELGVSGYIYEAGAMLGLDSVPGLAVLSGVRLIDVEVDVTLTPGPAGSARDRWADPFVGVRYTRGLGEHWYFDARGDLGGFGVSSDAQAQLVASIGYRFSERLEAFGGYRFLTVDFGDELVLDATAEGPGLGFTWSWQ
jgi:hypothetical protein